MELSDEAVIAASNSWIWVPDNATATETDEYLIVRFPDYFDHPLEVVRFTPTGPGGVPRVLRTVHPLGWMSGKVK
jgi:hypothetical protein